MSLKFLNTKSFHPATKANQKRVWVAEQQAREREQKERDKATEVRKAAEALHAQQAAAAQGDAAAARRAHSQQVNFLYAAPPGLPEAKEPQQKAQRQDGEEDEAVREFRRRAESRREPQRKLERYVGRRREEPLTVKDQVERFPMLKDAPVAGSYTQSLRVNFNPVGVRLRNVRCIRCGQWGHQSGDRECGLRDQNPHDTARQMREDPVTEINKLKTAKQELVFRRGALPLEMQEAGTGEEFEILQSDDDEVVHAKDAFLATLSTKQKKRLMRKLKKDQSSSDGDSDSDEPSRRHRSKKRKSSKHEHKHKHRPKHKHQRKDEAERGLYDKPHRRSSSRSRSRSRERVKQRRRNHARSSSPRSEECRKQPRTSDQRQDQDIHSHTR